MPIPRGDRGMAICHSSGIGGKKTYSLGFGFGVWGNLKIIFIENNFPLKFFLNQKNNMIFKIRYDKIAVN